MASLNKNNFFNSLMLYFPTLILFLSVLSEFDFNYLEIEYFAFNFAHIVIFYWTLKNPQYLSYGSIFIAGLINDVVIGIPIGISSFCYLLICAVTAYLRNITLSPNFINDWLSFLFTILLANSIQVVSLDLIFSLHQIFCKHRIHISFLPNFFIFIQQHRKKN